MDAARYADAARLIGIPIGEGTLFNDMRAIVAMRAPTSADDRPAATTKATKTKEPPDENVFRANYEDELDPTELANQWKFLKDWTLKPTDLAIGIDSIDENQEHLLTNGWYVVLKEMSQWHFRKDPIEDAPVPEGGSSADLIEEQEKEYAIAQVADYEREQSEKLQEKKEATASKEPAKEEAVKTVVPTATDELNHAYKRRLVTGLAMYNKLSSLSAIHEFASWVFESQEPCSTLEKRRFREFWNATDGNKSSTEKTQTDAGLTGRKRDRPESETAVSDVGEKKPIPVKGPPPVAELDTAVAVVTAVVGEEAVADADAAAPSGAEDAVAETEAADEKAEVKTCGAVPEAGTHDDALIANAVDGAPGTV